MSLLLAVLSSALLGGADFAGGLAAKRMRTVAVVIWSNAVGLAVALLAIVFVVGDNHSPPTSAGDCCPACSAASAPYCSIEPWRRA